MAATDRIVGSNVLIHFLLSGDTVGVDEVVLSADFTSFSFNRQSDVADVTAGNESARYEKPTIESMDWSLMMFDADITNIAKILPQSQGLMTIYPEGNTVGNPYFSFNTVITGFSEDVPFDGALEIDLSGNRQGAMVAEIGSVVT